MENSHTMKFLRLLFVANLAALVVVVYTLLAMLDAVKIINSAEYIKKELPGTTIQEEKSTSRVKLTMSE